MGGFRSKAIITSHETNPEALKHLGPVLGHDWSPESDELTFHFKIKAKLFNKRSKEILITLDNVKDLLLNRRCCLGILSQFYDPIGLCSPVVIPYRLAMKSIIVQKLDWDQELPDDQKKVWTGMITDMLKCPSVSFPRKAVGDEVDNPWMELIGYWDGSLSAFCAAIYVRWLEDPQSERWNVRLLTSKSRVTPCSGLTTPHSELCGLLMLCRLMNTAVESMSKPVRRITLIGGSF